MKIIRYQAPSGAALGIVEGETVYRAEGDFTAGFYSNGAISLGTVNGFAFDDT